MIFYHPVVIAYKNKYIVKIDAITEQNVEFILTRNQFDMYSFVSYSWCVFWQTNGMLLKWSIFKKKHVRVKTTKKSISSKGHSALCDF